MIGQVYINIKFNVFYVKIIYWIMVIYIFYVYIVYK